MANYERDHEGQVFDGGDDDDDGEGSHLPVVIIIAILVLAAFGGVVWLAYNQGIARGRGEPKVAVTETSKVSADNSGIKVYQQPAAAGEEEEAKGTASAGQAAPSQEQPSPQAAPAVPPQVAQTSPAPVQQAPVQQAPAQPQASQAAPVQTPAHTPAASPAIKVSPQTQTSSAGVPPKKVEPTPAKPVTAAAPSVQAPPPPATKPPAQLGLSHPAPAPSVAKAAATAPVTKPSLDTVAKSKAAGGSYLLQIGAYKSEADAMAAWKAYQGKHAALLAGFGPDVQKADLGDKGTWYRLRIASFPDKDGASALCDRLKAQNGSCFLAH